MNTVFANPLLHIDYINMFDVIPIMFFLLIFGHFLADYPLQGDFIARAKNKFAPVAGVPWWQAMTAHCAIHAGFVMIITNSVILGAIEFFIHFAIDYSKCAGKLTFNEDQYLHVSTKVIILILWLGLSI